MNPSPLPHLRSLRLRIVRSGNVGSISFHILRSLDKTQIDDITKEELLAALHEGADFLRSSAAVENDHRFLSLTHEFEFMIDDLSDDRVLFVKGDPTVHLLFRSHDTTGSYSC